MKTHIPFVAAIGDISRVKIFTNRLFADTIFDLASITKPLITLKYTLQVYQAGDKIFNIPVFRLITHTSGIPRQLPWMRWNTKEYFLNVSQYADAVQGFTYSCHNYNLLSYYVYLKTGKYPLEQINWHGGGYIGFNPKKFKDKILPVIDGQTFIGIPHDGKARMLKEKAGNAGLFGNIRGIIEIARLILKNQWYNVPLQHFYKPIIRGNQRYSLGWFLYGTMCKTCGKHFPFSSFGHSGFPGSFIWFHPDNMTFQIFLSHAINQIRRKNERFNFLKLASTWLYQETLKD